MVTINSYQKPSTNYAKVKKTKMKELYDRTCIEQAYLDQIWFIVITEEIRFRYHTTF